MNLQQRVKKLQSHLSDHQGMVLARPADIRYLTGFKIITSNEREAYLVLTKKNATLLYPLFSPIEKLAGIKYHPGHWPGDLHRVTSTLSSTKTKPIAEWQVDMSALFADELELLKTIPKTKWQKLDRQLIWDQRMIKDAAELKLIRQAGNITKTVINTIKSQLKPGDTELEVANQFQYMAKKLGASNVAFPPVIAFGSHSAMPHHQPTRSTLKNNQAVLIDVGAKVDGYCFDHTRSFWFDNQADPLFDEIKQIVDQAYKLAVMQVSAGNTASQVDQAARDYIVKKGYGKQFIHSTGHGLGLEIHEPPSLHESADYILQKNMVVTVEPGIYLEGKFGYRHENTIIVR